MKRNINMKDHLLDIQRLIWGCPVRILMHLLHLTLKKETGILMQLTSVECVPGAAKLSYSTSLLSARMLDEKRHRWAGPHPMISLSLSTLLGTTELMTRFEEWGHVFIVFYLPAHNIWCRILPTEDICKNPRRPLLVICYLRSIV